MNVKTTPQYLAGFFDADGHIGIYKRGEKTRRRKDGTIAVYSSGHAINFVIVNVHKGSLVAIQSLIGGTIHSRASKNPKHSTTHQLTLTSRQSILDCVNMMLPYLIVKKERCSLIKEYLESRLLSSPKKGSNTPISTRELEIVHLVRQHINDTYKKQSKHSW